MKPIIYRLPKIEKNIQLEPSDIYFEDQHSPKLIKFGFNNISKVINLVQISSVPQYRTGLNIDIERTDEQSIGQAMNKFGIKNFTNGFVELWEILVLFGIIKIPQNVYTTGSNEIINQINVLAEKTGLGPGLKIVKKSATLAVHQYSDVEIEENAAVQLIIDNLSNLLSSQNPAATMIIQLFGLQTMITAEIIYYLASLYELAYLVKPSISSNLSDVKYLVLTNLKAKSSFNLPTHASNLYLTSLGIDRISFDFTNVIQCLNAQIIPKKYQTYVQIKDYLNTKVYEGTRYQELLTLQNDNMAKWLETFIRNVSQAEKVTETAIQDSDNRCVKYDKLSNLLN